MALEEYAVSLLFSYFSELDQAVGSHVIMQMATDILSACHLKFYGYESNCSATHSFNEREKEKEKKKEKLSVRLNNHFVTTF